MHRCSSGMMEMTHAEIFKAYKQERQRENSWMSLVRLNCGCTVAVFLMIIPLGLLAEFGGSDNPIHLKDFKLELLTLCYLLQYRRSAKDLSSLTKLPEVFVHQIDTILRPLTHRMDLNARAISLWLEPRNFTSAPSTIESKGQINFILPLGFFKVVQVNPVCAEAMLGHELAHSLENDSGLLLIATGYFKATVLFLIAYLLSLTPIISHRSLATDPSFTSLRLLE